MNFETTNYAGIDYGLGQSNIDQQTGIRYGIIAVNSLTEWIYESLEGHYSQYCPHCGNELADNWEDENEQTQAIEKHHGGDCVTCGHNHGKRWNGHSEPVWDYKCHDCNCTDPSWKEDELDNPICPHCGDEINTDDGEQYAENPDYDELTNSEIEEATTSDGSELFIFKSPYYTHAQFCSPCVPGAGNLNTLCPNGPKTYCLPKEYFDNDECPYPYFSVSDGSLVYSPVE